MVGLRVANPEAGRTVTMILASIPILFIYRRYYGARTAALLFATFYATMAAAET